MNEAANDNGEGFGQALVWLGFLPSIIVFLVWLISAITAGLIAAARERTGWGFFLATFFFLGPLGVGVAMLATHGARDGHLPASPKRVVEGRQRFECPRCGADNYIPNADRTYQCWQCDEVRKVKPKVTEPNKS